MGSKYFNNFGWIIYLYSEIEQLLKNEPKICTRGNIVGIFKKLPAPILTKLQIVNGKPLEYVQGLSSKKIKYYIIWIYLAPRRGLPQFPKFLDSVEL